MSEKSARDIFASTKPKPRRRPPPPWMRRGPRPQAGEIIVSSCPDCGEQTSSFTNYACAGCHFRGWWGKWKEQSLDEALREAVAAGRIPDAVLESPGGAVELPSATQPEGEEVLTDSQDRAPGAVAEPVEREGGDGEAELVTQSSPPPTTSTLSEGESVVGSPSSPRDGSSAEPDPRMVNSDSTPSESVEPFSEDLTPSGISIRYYVEDKEAKVKRHYEIRAPLLTPESGGKTPDTEWETVVSVSTVVDKFKDSGGLINWAQKRGGYATRELLRRGLLHPYRLEDKTIVLGCPVEGGYIVPDEEQLYELMKQERLLTDDEKKKGGKRGQSAHDALELWAQKGEMPDPSFFPPEEAGYIEGLRMFLTALEKAEPEVIATERMVASVKHGFAGRYDLEIRTHKPTQIVKRWTPKRGPQYATLRPGLYVPDLKTSASVYKESHFVQLEGYEIGRIESGYPPSDARGVIHVHPGDPKKKNQPDEPYYEFVKSTAKPSAFLATLALYREYQDL